MGAGEALVRTAEVEASGAAIEDMVIFRRLLRPWLVLSLSSTGSALTMSEPRD